MNYLINFFLETFIKDKLFYRFIVIGTINTIIGYSIYALLICLNVHYLWAMLVSTVIGTLFNFKTTGTIIFKNSQNRLFLKFIMVYGLVYILNIAIIRVITGFYNNQYIDGAIALSIVVPIAFVLNKKFVFQGKT
jgi:putative flippase GtrA